MTRKIKLLIDGDILVYRMGFASQSSGEIEPLSNALYLVKKFISDMQNKFDTFNIKIYLTADDKSNFRFKIATTKPYKGNRDKKVNPNAAGRPEHYDDIRKYLVEKYEAVVISGIEADDALGIHQMKYLHDPDLHTILISIDKDLDMIPGTHYNFLTDEIYESKDFGKLELASGRKKLLGTGKLWFYAQMLLGDKSDNIPGLTGYGPVKVYDVLSSAENELQAWEIVQKEYISALEEDNDIKRIYDRLYEVADLLWIWREENDCQSTRLKSLGELK